MASLTTGQFLAQFAGLPGKLTAQGLGVATIHSAVMDPEDESVRRDSIVARGQVRVGGHVFGPAAVTRPRLPVPVAAGQWGE